MTVDSVSFKGTGGWFSLNLRGNSVGGLPVRDLEGGSKFGTGCRRVCTGCGKAIGRDIDIVIGNRGFAGSGSRFFLFLLILVCVVRCIYTILNLN